MRSAGLLAVFCALIFVGESTDFNPTSIKCSSTSVTVTVTWSDPSDGPAYLYEVGISGGGFEQTEILYSSVHEHTFSEGILPFTDYLVNVSAISLLGDIGFGRRSVKTWPGFPEMPEIASITYYKGQPQLDIQWLEPRLNGDLFGYVLKWFSEGQPVEEKFLTVKSFRTDELANGYYFVELQARTSPISRNKCGGDSPTNRVGPIPIPPIKSNVSLVLTQVNLGAIRLQWDFSQVETACGIYSNTIYYTHGNHTHKDVLIPASNQYILTNLDPGVNYTVRVSADCVGSIAAITKEVQIAPEQHTPSAPQNLVVKVTSNSMDVSWSPPASPNGRLEAYTVTISDGTTVSQEVQGLNASFPNLRPLTKYTVTVKAKNAAGYGPAASITVTTDPDGTQLPKAPKDLKATLQSPTSAMVTWNKPEESSLPITGYLLSFRQQGGKWESVSISGDTITYFLTGLQPSSMYELSLRASSQFFNGEPANATLSTVVAAPSLPSNIRATQISADEVRITWDPPMSSRSGAEGEEMIVKSFKGGVLQKTAKKPISEGAHAVNEIEPNTVMSFTVQVVSPGPLGGFSEIKQLPDLITWPAPMAAPKGLKLTATGENSLHASWTENEDKTLLLKYEIRVTAVDTKKTDTHFTESTSFSINNLDTFTEYTVEVAAVGKPNQNGEGSVAGAVSAAKATTWPGRGGIPAELTASATDTSILLSWKQPQGRPTGIVKHYEVTVKDKTGNEPYKAAQTLERTFTAQSLRPLTMYTVEVRAMNKPDEVTGKGGGLGDPAILVVETLPSGGGRKLSGGAIAGIVIGVILAFVLLLLLLLVLMRRRDQNVMIDDFQWSEGTGVSFFVDDIEMSQLGSDVGSML
ncbi:fibronectin [Sparganum proliferum]